MSGYNRPYNRSAAGKSDGRIKHTNDDSWRHRRSSQTKIAIDRSSDSDSCCQKGQSSVSREESVVKDVASSMQNTEISMPVPSENDDTSKKVKLFGDKPQDVGNECASLESRFDICPKRDGPVKLKPSLHATNREKRNLSKRSVEGQHFVVLRPGMVLMKGYISCDDQISIVKTCRGLGIGNGGFYQPGYSGGTKLHLKMMCLGKNWEPEGHSYSEFRSFDNSKPPGIPAKFHDIVKKAIQDSNERIRVNIANAKEGEIIPSMSPDICIVNFYTKTGRLGLHQDKDESEESLKSGLPVVSFSIGDSAEFLYGDTRDIDSADKVILESGDILIFGGKSRLIFHGVTNILLDTAPKSLLDSTDMRQGRLNLTFRKY